MDLLKQEQQSNLPTGKDINIDINGDGGQETADGSAIKSMSPADTTSRAGLSKEELMKYANEPFWVRLRNILFASFWIIWLSIFFGALAYVINSPGCKVVSAETLQGAANSTASMLEKKLS